MRILWPREQVMKSDLRAEGGIQPGTCTGVDEGGGNVGWKCKRREHDEP